MTNNQPPDADDSDAAPAMPKIMYECPICKCWHGGEQGLCFRCELINQK